MFDITLTTQHGRPKLLSIKDLKSDTEASITFKVNAGYETRTIKLGEETYVVRLSDYRWENFYVRMIYANLDLPYEAILYVTFSRSHGIILEETLKEHIQKPL